MQTNNKYKINSWRTVLFLLLVLSFTACSKEHIGTVDGTDEKTISFDCMAKNLRVTETTSDNLQYFRVSAEWKKESAVFESFMDNQLVEKQGDTWVYSPVKQWPGYGSVSFFAHSPATSSGLEYFKMLDASDETYIEYTVDTNYSRQEDFMVALNFRKKENPVLLKFEHLLSKLNFHVCSNSSDTIFRIKKIKLTNLCSKGVSTGVISDTKTTWHWYEQVDPKDYVVYQKYAFETQDSSYREIGSLMVLPQPYPENGKIAIEVEYDIVGTSETGTLEYVLNNEFLFDAGIRYTFLLKLSTASKKRSAAKTPVRLDVDIISTPY